MATITITHEVPDGVLAHYWDEDAAEKYVREYVADHLPDEQILNVTVRWDRDLGCPHTAGGEDCMCHLFHGDRTEPMELTIEGIQF